MSKREVVLDQPEFTDEQGQALRQAQERAERAEAELAKLKQAATHKPASATHTPAHETQKPKAAAHSPASDAALKTPASPSSKGEQTEVAGDGEDELRKDSMMAHLLDSLEAGQDIGHYGRLVFAMVARHFLPHEDVLAWMMKDKDVDEEKATLMLRQVEGRDYSPPRRDKILEYQSKQDFPIIPNVDDPDSGNLYRNLKFPDEIYNHIGHYQEAKLESGS